MMWMTDFHDWDADCERCGTYTLKGMDTKPELKSAMLSEGWTFKHEKCYCPKCTKIKEAWVHTRTRIETYVSDNNYVEMGKLIMEEADLIEKELGI